MAETPPTMPTLCPHLVCDGASEAIAFYEKAFGAQEIIRLPGEDGRLMHAALTIGDSMIKLVDENAQYGVIGPKTLGGSPVTLHLNVANADVAIERAAAAGATVKVPAADMFWGDRYGMVVDPWGHSWSMAHPLRGQPLSEAELREASKGTTCGMSPET